jgi:hypothetical protein
MKAGRQFVQGNDWQKRLALDECLIGAVMSAPSHFQHMAIRNLRREGSANQSVQHVRRNVPIRMAIAHGDFFRGNWPFGRRRCT